MNKKEIVLFWSGGKDSALALQKLKQQSDISVKLLLTTITKNTNTVIFHGISENLLVEQAKLIGIPLQRVYIPERCPNSEYNRIVAKALKPYIKRGIKDVAFGDLCLQDIRTFKEKQMTKLGLNCHFPLWNISIDELSKYFWGHNFRAVITSILTERLEHQFLGKELTPELVQKLPREVNPFGENGEFHTIITYAPYFKQRLQTSISITKNEGPYEVCQLRCP